MKPERLYGFTSMTPEQLREVSKRGGMSVKPENRSFKRDRDLAVEAGRKGGRSRQKPKGANGKGAHLYR